MNPSGMEIALLPFALFVIATRTYDSRVVRTQIRVIYNPAHDVGTWHVVPPARTRVVDSLLWFRNTEIVSAEPLYSGKRFDPAKSIRNLADKLFSSVSFRERQLHTRKHRCTTARTICLRREVFIDIIVVVRMRETQRWTATMWRYNMTRAKTVPMRRECDTVKKYGRTRVRVYNTAV